MVANFDYWIRPVPWRRLSNEPNLPAMVWSLAQPD